MDVATCIAGKIGELLVEPIWRQFGYFIHYKCNIEQLQEQVKILEGVRHDVQASIDAAKRNSEVIREEVQNWTEMVDDILSDAKKLLGKAPKVRFHNMASHCQLSRKAVKKTMAIEKHKIEGKFDGVSKPVPPTTLLFPSQEDILISGSREQVMEEIMAALKDNKTHFIGIHGMGGVGKTTLVKEVAKRAQADKLFDTITMVVVSQTVNVKKIQDQIAERLGLKLNENNEQDRVSRLLARLKEENKVLIILDDIWARLDRTTLGIPFGHDHIGCKIVVTTRRRQACESMVHKRETAKIIPIHVLSEKESWVLLKMNVGDDIESPSLNSFAKDILKECGGLPIALVTVGRAMRSKDPDEWQVAVEKLKKAQPQSIEGMDKDVYKCLQFSYDYLGYEEAKKIFMLCCLFPEDFDIPVEDLVRYGIGLKIYEDMRIEEAKRSAHYIIKYLKDSHLLLESNKEGCIKMHDVVCDVALSMASDYFVRDGVKKLEDWPSMERTKYYTGISIMQNNISRFPDDWDCPNLKILLMDAEDASSNRPVHLPKNVLVGMKALQVFHRRDISRQEYIFHFRRLQPNFSQLTNLRTLMLQYYKIGDTTTIGELKMLEILSFKQCMFLEPFSTIGKLTNLRLLDMEFSFVSHFSSSLFPTNTVFNLSRLEELYLISFKRSHVRTIQKFSTAPFHYYNKPSFDAVNITELKSMARLTTLTIHLRTILEGFMFPDLKVFKIHLGKRIYSGEKENMCDIFLSHVEGSNYLGLSGKPKHGNNITISSLVCIKLLLPRTNYLCLESFEDLENIIPCLLLGRLDALKILVIASCDSFNYLINVEELQGKYVLFSELEGLYFRELKTFKALCNGELPLGTSLSMRKVKHLFFSGCPELLNVFTLLSPQQQFEQLQDLVIDSCPALEYIFEDKGTPLCLRELRLSYLKGMKYIWKSPFELLHLHKLQIVRIDECEKLKFIFPASIAQGLEQLKELEVKQCDQLEAIVANRQEGEENIDNVVFSQLTKISLDELFNLEAFCMDNLPFKWPSLKKAHVRYCLKMKTFTAIDGNQTTPNLKVIYLNAKEIKLDGTDLNMVLKSHNKWMRESYLQAAIAKDV